MRSSTVLFHCTVSVHYTATIESVVYLKMYTYQLTRTMNFPFFYYLALPQYIKYQKTGLNPAVMFTEYCQTLEQTCDFSQTTQTGLSKVLT